MARNFQLFAAAATVALFALGGGAASAMTTAGHSASTSDGPSAGHAAGGGPTNLHCDYRSDQSGSAKSAPKGSPWRCWQEEGNL
jgi:hypothetical protein